MNQLESQAGQSPILANTLRPIWLPATPHPKHNRSKAPVLIQSSKQWKSPYSSPHRRRARRRRIRAFQSTYPVKRERATPGPPPATPIDIRPFAKACCIQEQRRKSHDSSLHSQVALKGQFNPENQSTSPTKRPRTPPNVGQTPIKNDADGAPSETLLESIHTGASNVPGERPSPKKRCTVSGMDTQIKGRKTVLITIPPYRRKRRARLNSQKPEKCFGASNRRAFPTEGMDSNESRVGKDESPEFKSGHLGKDELESIAKATSNVAGKVPRSEILRILGDIEEMTERYTELLRTPVTKSSSGKSREEIMLEIEKCRDAASHQLLGLCRESGRTRDLALLLGSLRPTYETADSDRGNCTAGGTYRLGDTKSPPEALNFFSATGIRQHGNGGNAEGGKAVIDEPSKPNSVPGIVLADTAYRKKENRRDGSSSSSDRNQRTFGGPLQSRHYLEDSDDEKSEEAPDLLSKKGKGGGDDGNEDAPMNSPVSSPCSIESQQIFTNYDKDGQEYFHAHRRGFPQNGAEGLPRHASPPIEMLEEGTSSATTSHRSRPQRRRSSMHSSRWRPDSSRQRSSSSRPGGILKKGSLEASVSPKRVMNVGRRNSQNETEVATVTYLPESAPAASRALGIPMGENLVGLVFDVPPPKPGSKTLPLGSGPDEQVETLSHLTGEPGSAKPGPLYDRSDRLAERKLIKMAFRRRCQSDGNSAGSSRSIVKARLRGVRAAKLLGSPVSPGSDEDPAIFDSDLDELGSDAATTQILKSGRYSDAEQESELGSHDEDSEYDGGYRVRSLLTPFETDSDKNKPPRRPSTKQNASNPSDTIGGHGHSAVAKTSALGSMATQQSSHSLGRAPPWAGEGVRRSKSTSPGKAAKRGFSGIFGPVAPLPSDAIEGPSTGSFRRRMKSLLLKPLSPRIPAETILPIRTKGPLPSSVDPSSHTSTESPQLATSPRNIDMQASSSCLAGCTQLPTCRCGCRISPKSRPTDAE